MSWLLLLAAALGMFVPAIVFKSTENIRGSWVRLFVCILAGLLFAWACTYSIYLQFMV